MLKRYLLNKGFKKRYVVFGLIAFELASLPAAAQILRHSVFPSKTPSYLDVTKLTAEANHQRFRVASDEEFYITTDLVDTKHAVRLYKTATQTVETPNTNTQIPGAILACSKPSFENFIIYRALRGTEAPATSLSSNMKALHTKAASSVIVDVQYEGEIEPNIKFQQGQADLSKFNTLNCTH